jgi:hypothetical protein
MEKRAQPFSCCAEFPKQPSRMSAHLGNGTGNKLRALTGAVIIAAGCGGGGSSPEGLISSRAALSDPVTVSPPFGLGAPQLMASYVSEGPRAVATTDGVHMIVSSKGGRLSAVRVSGDDNTPIDPTPLTLVRDTDPCHRVGNVASAGNVAIVETADVFMVSWENNGSVCALRMGSDGVVLDPAPFRLPAGSRVSGAGGYFLVTWTEDSGTGSNDVVGRRYQASDGAALDATSFPIAAFSGSQSLTTVASDGSSYLVLWRDGRDGNATYATRVRASDREVLDPDGVKVGAVGTPSVAFDGTSFMLVWASSNGSSEYSVVRMRLGSDAVPLDAQPVALTAPAWYRRDAAPAIVADGTGFTVVWLEQMWIEGTETRDIYSMQLGPTGAPLTSAIRVNRNIVNGSFTTAPSGHCVASFGGRLLVLWNQFGGTRDAFGVQLSEAYAWGTPLSRTAPWQSAPAVSFDGQYHLVVWHEHAGRREPMAGNVPTFSVRAARLRDSDGELLDPEGFDLGPPPSPQSAPHLFPRTASNGSNHLVAWLGGAAIRFTRVGASDGALLDDPPRILTIASATPDVASDGEDYMVVWSAGGVYGQRIRGQDGALLDASPRLLASSGTRPALAFVAPYYLLVWRSDLTIMAQRVQPDGSLVGTPLIVSNPQQTGEPLDNPRAVALGDGVAAVLASGLNSGRLRRIRISDATPLDSGPLTVVETSQYGLAADGEHLLISVYSYPGTSGPSDLRLLRLPGSLPGLRTLPIATDPDWLESSPTLSVGLGGRVLAVHVGFDPSPGMGTERLSFRWIRQASGTTCGANQHVSSHACVACDAGSTRAAGDDPGGADTACTATACDTDEYVSSHACAACAAGSVRPAGDLATGPDTACAATVCAANQYVANHACVACAAGSTRPAGDLATGPDTACGSAIVCGTNEHVANHACVACAAGSLRAAGDLASGPDTSCAACTVLEGCAAVTCTTTSDSTCTACSSGRYLAGGSCHVCSTCAAGTHASAACSATADTVCTACTAVAGCAGAVTCTTAGDSICSECAPGSHASGNGAACTPCAAGTYADAAGATACTQCPANSFAAAGATACQACPAGTTAAAGSGACSPASTGGDAGASSDAGASPDAGGGTSPDAGKDTGSPPRMQPKGGRSGCSYAGQSPGERNAQMAVGLLALLGLAICRRRFVGGRRQPR